MTIVEKNQTFLMSINRSKIVKIFCNLQKIKCYIIVRAVIYLIWTHFWISIHLKINYELSLFHHAILAYCVVFYAYVCIFIWID